MFLLLELNRVPGQMITLEVKVVETVVGEISWFARVTTIYKP